MRRILIPIAFILALALSGQAAASFERPAQPSLDDLMSKFEPKAIHAFRGEVVSVDPQAGTIEADVAYLNDGPRIPEAGERTRVTFVTDEATEVHLDGRRASVADLREGDHITVAIIAGRDASLEEVLATPAWVASAVRIPAFYGFAGRITAVDAEAGRISLAVRYTTRSARKLIGKEKQVLSFSTGADTVIHVDGRRGSLADLGRGDVAGVGIVAPRRASLDEVLATPALGVVASTKGRAGPRRLARMGKRAARVAAKQR